MKTFDNLEAGTVLVNKENSEEMTVTYVDWDCIGKKEFCLYSTKSIFRGNQFDPTDWEIKQ